MAPVPKSPKEKRSWLTSIVSRWQARPLTADTFRSLFKPDHSRQASQNEAEAAKEAAKVRCFMTISISYQTNINQ